MVTNKNNAYWYGTTNGREDHDNSANGKSYCPQRTGINSGTGWSAVCTTWEAIVPDKAWLRDRSCPKGWGRWKQWHGADQYTVYAAQGYVDDNKTPVYSDITKYRTAYHNYITTRVAKA